jgi:integrase/recombinase XerD
MLIAAKIKYLTAEQVEAVINNAGSLRNKALLFLIYNCALRRSEVRLLIRDDYDKEHGVLCVTRLKKKTPRVHEIVLWNSTKGLLDKYLKSRKDHNDALFLSRKRGDALNYKAVYHIFKNAARKARITMRGHKLPGPHSLRHSFAVHSMNMGMPVELIKDHLAHESINTTLVYAQVMTTVKLRWAKRQEASHHFAKLGT